MSGQRSEPSIPHASEIRADLQRLKRDTESGKTVTSHRSHLSKLSSAVALVLVVAIIAVAAYCFRSGGRSNIDSVAVLPFSNASRDPNTDYTTEQHEMELRESH